MNYIKKNFWGVLFVVSFVIAYLTGNVVFLAAGMLTGIMTTHILEHLRLKRQDKELMSEDIFEETMYEMNKEVNVLYGTQDGFHFHFSLEHQEGPLRILRAAIKLNDGQLYSVNPPWEYRDCLTAVEKFSGVKERPVNVVFGFIDSEGSFIDSDQACVIARGALQLQHHGRIKIFPPYLLFPQDLWGYPILNKEEA